MKILNATNSTECFHTSTSHRSRSSKRQHYHRPEQFYSSLTDSDISTKDYEDAKKVWSSFKNFPISENTRIFTSKTDVLLLVGYLRTFEKRVMRLMN
ncbi:unnamed protein product [Trichogramma brassicae]|uniref:Uncharacterized protein n=1 Tax=Trichogramma brassicae TaxID=86971 RepID=A0A6H5IU67_9HYME|nr:unnamed protein product [Trichogramma brassicae]